MSTIANRVRIIAQGLSYNDGTREAQAKHLLHEIATELEAAPAADASERMAPVQGYSAGIPWSLHLEAYDAYCKRYGPQPALIDLEGRNCRGGFSTGELDEFIPGWRERVSAIAALQAQIAELEARQVQQANRLFAHIEHGDAEHRAWLRREIDAFFTADPAPIFRPKGREAGRMGDMAPPGHSHMRVGLDGDNDVYVSVWEQEREAWAGIEFCTYSGGGKSPKTREALIALMVAIEADNAETPSHQWPQAAAPSNPTGGAT